VLADATTASRDTWECNATLDFTRNIMRVKCGPAAGPLCGVCSFSLRFGTTMEQIRNADHVTVIRDEFIEARSVKIEPAPVQRIDRALAAAASKP
jgi:hypothetical protein